MEGEEPAGGAASLAAEPAGGAAFPAVGRTSGAASSSARSTEEELSHSGVPTWRIVGDDIKAVKAWEWIVTRLKRLWFKRRQFGHLGQHLRQFTALRP